ncbi:arsenic resistance protein [Priestia filamentosa]|uniref:arsenic resistance protein n=1 Tax=Priestia filamentosa TaxID=1402861 RepID=UPI002E219FBA|nr:bile acid:sodium symporter [Priestia filamentosa]
MFYDTWSFLDVSFKETKTALSHKGFLISVLILNFIIGPLVAYGIGRILLDKEPFIFLGFLMLVVTPCTDWYLLFTKLAKGNVPLAASLLPVNLLLQIALLPFYLYLFSGVKRTFSISMLLESVFYMFLLPFLLAIIIKRRKGRGVQKWRAFFTSSGMLFLSLAVMMMLASEGSYLSRHFSVLYVLLLPLLVFFIITFLAVFLISKVLRFKTCDGISLHFITLARNSPLALAMATIAFEKQPEGSLALGLGPLIELLLLAFMVYLFLCN